MGSSASSPKRGDSEPPAPFELPFDSEEYLEGNNLFRTEDHLPQKSIADHKCIVGCVVDACDGDTLRIRHIPNGNKLYPYPHNKKRMKAELFKRCEPWRGKLKGETIRIRLYGVDAPETQKFGNPGQPFAEEATKYVKEKLLNRIVFVRLLSKDQYGRIVAQVLVPCSALGAYTSTKSTPSLNTNKPKCCPIWFWNRRANELKLTHKERHEWCEDICQDLVMEGLAMVYRGASAQYAGRKERLERLESDAKRKGLRIWSGPEDAFESPGSFKRRLRIEANRNVG